MAGGAADRPELIVVCATAVELPKTASANRNVNRRASIAKISLDRMIEAEQGAARRGGGLQKVTADKSWVAPESTQIRRRLAIARVFAQSDP
jgi:hypothetical protein